MAAIVSTGGVWPVDRARCERGNVIIMSAEDDPGDTIRPRLEAAGANLERVHVVECVMDSYRGDGSEHRRGFCLDRDIPRLGDLMKEIGDVALVIVDPITAFLGDADSHKNAEVRALLAPLAELAAQHGAAIVCVSHLTKNGDADALMRVMGSLAFVAAARAAYVVARDRDDQGRRLFLPLKNNLGVDQTGLAFRVEGRSIAGGIETSCVVWELDAVTVTADEAMAPEPRGEERSTIEEARDFLTSLLADGPIPSKVLKADADGAGFSWATIRRAADSLGVEREKLGMKKGWVWNLAPKVLKKSEDAQDSVCSTFGSNEHLRDAGEPPKMLKDYEDAKHKELSTFGNHEHLRGNESSGAKDEDAETL
jgi:putative DNA primase/helicase